MCAINCEDCEDIETCELRPSNNIVKCKHVEVMHSWEDLGYTYKPGMKIHVEVQEGCFYKHGMNVIPKEYCKVIG